MKGLLFSTVKSLGRNQQESLPLLLSCKQYIVAKKGIRMGKGKAGGQFHLSPSSRQPLVEHSSRSARHLKSQRWHFRSAGGKWRGGGVSEYITSTNWLCHNFWIQPITLPHCLFDTHVLLSEQRKE